VLYGAPGIGKSFMSIDIALSVAYGMTWHDKVTKQGAVLYIAAEGVGGLGKRVKAWQAHYDTHGVTDFHVLPMAVKILEAPDLEKLLRTIDNFGVQFSMIVIDTVARTLASTGSDENDATAMGQFGEMCGVIQRHAGCAVLAVHHSGKDAARGMRGSSSLLGLSDTVLELTASEALLTLKVQKQKDAEPAQDATYELTPIQLIDDSSAILLPTEAAEKKRGAKLSERQLIALQALRNGLIDLQATQMSVNRWHDLHKDKAPDLTAAQRRDARAGLQDKGVIVIDGGKVWVNRDVGVNV
jgi:predicted ATP-dependent serine protease